jgi:uncharacterized membrane protein
MHWHHWGGWGVNGWLFWAVLMIVLVALFARPVGSRLFARGARRSPEAILKERYARGEIDRAQYEGMLQDLRR